MTSQPFSRVDDVIEGWMSRRVKGNVVSYCGGVVCATG